MSGGFRHRLQLDQNILTGELRMRIPPGRDIASGLDAVMVIENLRGRAERRVDLILAPDVKRALSLLLRRRSRDFTVGIFGGEEPPVSRRHVAPHVVEDTAGDS